MSMRIKILATGKYLPKNRVTAANLEERLGLETGWIAQKSGVLVRYFVEGETASQMGAFAAREALQTAGLGIEDIDCLVCTSSVPEQAIPCTAALVQQQLGAGESGIPAFDLNATCLSFLCGLDTLSYLVAAGRYRRVLLIATEVTTGMNWSDKESCTLFGDGAAAVIIEASPEEERSQILAARIETYSHGASLSECRGAGNKHHPKQYFDNPEFFLFTMQGRALYRLSAQILPGFLERLLKPVHCNLEDMKMVIPHQASLMAMRLIRKHLGVPEERWMTIAHDHGNTVAASIPMALHEAIAQKKIQRGDQILLLGTAAGFSVGGIVLVY